MGHFDRARDLPGRKPAPVGRDGGPQRRRLLDLVTANCPVHGNISVLSGRGDGTFRLRTDLPAVAGTSRPAAVVLGDVNGDGRLDVVTANPG